MTLIILYVLWCRLLFWEAEVWWVWVWGWSALCCCFCCTLCWRPRRSDTPTFTTIRIYHLMAPETERVWLLVLIHMIKAACMNKTPVKKNKINKLHSSCSLIFTLSYFPQSTSKVCVFTWILRRLWCLLYREATWLFRVSTATSRRSVRLAGRGWSGSGSRAQVKPKSDTSWWLLGPAIGVTATSGVACVCAGARRETRLWWSTRCWATIRADTAVRS